jgi:cardiolipin synthase
MCSGESILVLKSAKVLLLVCFLLIVGCATTLPDISTLEQGSVDGGTLTITGARGQLAQREANRTIAGLQRQAGLSELLEDHISLIQSLSGQPLTMGNRAELLVDGPATNAAMLKASFTGKRSH